MVWQSSLFSCLDWKYKFNFHSAFVRQRSMLRNMFTVEFENACGKIFCEELGNTDMKTAGQIGRRAGTGSFFHGIPEGLHSSACRNGTRQVQVSHLGWFLLFQTRTSNRRPFHVIKTRSEPEQPLEGWLVLRRCVSVCHSGTV